MRTIAQNSRGFTLLELVIVMVLLAAVLAVAVPYASRSNKGAKARQEGLNLVCEVQFALDLARTTGQPTRLVLNTKANSVCLEIGTPGDPQAFKAVDGFWGQPRYLDHSIQIQAATNFATDEDRRWLCFDPGRPWPVAGVSLAAAENTYTVDIQGQKVELHESGIENN